jgi:hypothetical protein
MGYDNYTHYGIGHPTTLWEITRDCAGLDLVSNNNMDFEGDQPCKGDGEKQGGDDSDDDRGNKVEDKVEDKEEDKEEEECNDNDPNDAEMKDSEDQDQEEDEEDNYHVSF